MTKPITIEEVVKDFEKCLCEKTRLLEEDTGKEYGKHFLALSDVGNPKPIVAWLRTTLETRARIEREEMLDDLEKHWGSAERLSTWFIRQKEALTSKN